MQNRGKHPKGGAPASAGGQVIESAGRSRHVRRSRPRGAATGVALLHVPGNPARLRSSARPPACALGRPPRAFARGREVGRIWRMRHDLTPGRIRGRRLQAIRRDHFALHPLCVHCLAMNPPRITEATELDHIVALEDGGTDFDRPGNRQGLCKPCHRVKTADDRGYKPTGCDASGFPTDPRHPWNKGNR